MSQESGKMQAPIARHATQTNNKPIPKPKMEDGGNPCFSDKKTTLIESSSLGRIGYISQTEKLSLITKGKYR
jgi:hypothetical protein